MAILSSFVGDTFLISDEATWPLRRNRWISFLVDGWIVEAYRRSVVWCLTMRLWADLAGAFSRWRSMIDIEGRFPAWFQWRKVHAWYDSGVDTDGQYRVSPTSSLAVNDAWKEFYQWRNHSLLTWPRCYGWWQVWWQFVVFKAQQVVVCWCRCWIDVRSIDRKNKEHWTHRKQVKRFRYKEPSWWWRWWCWSMKTMIVMLLLLSDGDDEEEDVMWVIMMRMCAL